MFSMVLNIFRKMTLPTLVLGAFILFSFCSSQVVSAAPGVNEQLNFQGRLYNSQGATVPDGYYNIEFKIYQDGDGLTANNTTGTPAGSLKWTESYLNADTKGVQVKNGFMSVNLGSVNPFASNIDWNQNTLWLSINVGGTGAACTPFASCSPDGEMLPMKRLSATPYALNTSKLNGLTSNQFVQLAQGVQTDASTNTSSIHINKTGTGNLISLQSNNTDAFIINNSGDVTFGNNANHTISVTTADASTIGKSMTITSGAAGSGAAALAGGDLILQGGNGGGTNGNGGNLTLDAGIKNGTGIDGAINIGTSTASTIQIGSTTLATGTQTINVGNNNTAGSTTNITIGAGGSSTGGSTTIQAKNNVTISTNGLIRGTFDIANTLYLGNGITAANPNSFTIKGTGSTTTAVAGGTINIQGGNATTGNADGGNLVLDAGTKAGTGADGLINIGTTAASTIQIGNATLSSGTQTINLGNNNTAGGTTNVTVGSGGSASGGTTTLQAKGNIVFNSNGITRATIDNANNLYLGNGVTAATPTNFTVAGTGSTTTAVAGGSINVQGGNATVGNANGGTVSINAGAFAGTGADGNINIGNSRATVVQIGNSTLASGTQTINIGNNNTAGGTTNVTIGSGSSATGGSTTIQSKNNTSITSSAGTITINSNGNASLTSTAGTIALTSSGNTTIGTNGTIRATFDTANSMYLGNGVTAAAPSNFTISGTGSTTTAVTGGALTVQGGNASVGSANGGNLILSGGSGVGTGSNGLVVINAPTFSTTINDANCYTGGALVANSCTISAASVNNTGAVLVGFNTTGKTATLPDPTIATAGRIVYVTAANGTQDFTLYVNAGGMGNLIAMRQNTTATMIWNGNDWTAAGASSSTTLQSAYDNTMQSAGGAELIVSHTSTTNGLTIRDSSTDSVNGTLLAIQNSSAAGLFSVSSNVTEYSTDSGAETAGASASTFPANTWSANGSTAISRYTTAGGNIATGQASVSAITTTAAQDGVKNTLSTALTANMHYNVSFSARLLTGTFTDMNVYYSINGTTASVVCKASQAIITSVWTKVNCDFAAPASGITSTNAILIRQTTGGTARTFYVDNLSVTIAADYNYATDGNVYDSAAFATNWSFVNAGTGVGTVTRNSSDGNDASDSATVAITTGAVNAGIRNKLSINPLVNTLYRIAVYAKLSSGTFTDFKIRYSRDGSTAAAGNYIDCVDYNTQTISTTGWTQVTCYIKTDGVAATNPYVNFSESTATVRTFHVDTFSMTLSSNTTPNVQIGSGVTGGPTTLFTLDRSSSAPVAANNDALLGSMYYDTSLGKLQCYEADGWGACGSSPDNIVTISPEYTNAVMHGTGVGTMTSDICSSSLNINDGTLSQPTICGANETYNFYKWTSPQASAQTYSIYVTYQLPDTFKSFASGQTSVRGRTDSSNSTVQYQIYKSDEASGLTACGSANSVSTGVQSSWQVRTASGASDPSTCGFGAGNSIVFKISMTASQNANAYVSNLNFTFSNK